MGVDGLFWGLKNGSLLGFVKLVEMGNDFVVEMILVLKRVYFILGSLVIKIVLKM